VSIISLLIASCSANNSYSSQVAPVDVLLREAQLQATYQTTKPSPTDTLVRSAVVNERHVSRQPVTALKRMEAKSLSVRKVHLVTLPPSHWLVQITR
jgi:hypothetical protein